MRERETPRARVRTLHRGQPRGACALNHCEHTAQTHTHSRAHTNVFNGASPCFLPWALETSGGVGLAVCEGLTSGRDALWAEEDLVAHVLR